MERGAERDARSSERELSALLGVMVRQVEGHVAHGLPLGETIGVAPKPQRWGDLNDRSALLYRRSDATKEQISDSAIDALSKYLVSLGGTADMVAGCAPIARPSRTHPAPIPPPSHPARRGMRMKHVHAQPVHVHVHVLAQRVQVHVHAQLVQVHVLVHAHAHVCARAPGGR